VHEVELKLKHWALEQNDIDSVVDELVESDFINEKRFLTSFVRGKFNINKWGRQKIKMALRQKNFNDEDITSALTKLDKKEYAKTAQALINRKWDALKGTENRIRKSKVYYYILSKGYEPNIVVSLIDEKSRAV